MTKDEIKAHSEFLADFAEHSVYFATGDGHKAERIHDFVIWLANQTFNHAVKHCNQDAKTQQDDQGVPVSARTGEKAGWCKGEGWVSP